MSDVRRTKLQEAVKIFIEINTVSKKKTDHAVFYDYNEVADLSVALVERMWDKIYSTPLKPE